MSQQKPCNRISSCVCFCPFIRPPCYLWNYLSKIRYTPLLWTASGCYRFLEAGSIFSWFGLVRLNWLFTTSVSPDCLGLVYGGVNFRLFSSVFKFSGTWKICEYSCSIFPPSCVYFRCPRFGGTFQKDALPVLDTFFVFLEMFFSFVWSN